MASGVAVPSAQHAALAQGVAPKRREPAWCSLAAASRHVYVTSGCQACSNTSPG